MRLTVLLLLVLGLVSPVMAARIVPANDPSEGLTRLADDLEEQQRMQQQYQYNSALLAQAQGAYTFSPQDFQQLLMLLQALKSREWFITTPGEPVDAVVAGVAVTRRDHIRSQ